MDTTVKTYRPGTLAALVLAVVASGAFVLLDTTGPNAGAEHRRNQISGAPGWDRSAGDWRAAGSARSESAAQLLSEAGIAAESNEPVDITVVKERNGRPVVKVVTVKSAAAARQAMAAAQREADTVAVDVDTPVSVLDGDTTGAEGTDPHRPKQWALNTLQADAVWPHSRGANTVVAVIDTGVDGRHVDLKPRLLAGKDYVDTSRDGRTDPHKHGTHVAGIVAATAGNNEGIAGLAPESRILPVRVLNETGVGVNSHVAAGIIWAADNGAHVINLSLGGGYHNATSTAVAYAISRGVTVVAAGGNNRSGGSPTSYPAAYPGVVAVAATTASDTSAPFSNIGSYIDVAAPGNLIFSTVPVEASTSPWSPGYDYSSGTSMAAPYAAAAVALAHAASGGKATSAELVDRLLSTARDLGPKGRDNEFGHGLIQPKALVCSFTVCGTTPDTPEKPTTPPPAPTPQPDTEAPKDRSSAVVIAPKNTRYLWAGRRAKFVARVWDSTNGGPVANHRVAVEGMRGNKVVFRAWRRTDAQGHLAINRPLQRSTTFRIRTPRTATHEATATTGPEFLVMTRFAPRYSETAAQVRVFPARRQPMELQRNVRGTWRDYRVVQTNKKGFARVEGLPRGVWRMRIGQVPGLEDALSAVWDTRR